MKTDGKGLRHNGDKTPMELVPASLIFAVAEVLKVGAKKYAPRNWERGMSWSTVIGCCLRHLFKWISPFHSDYDEETGLNHLWHAACNIAMLIEYQYTCPDLDDRSKYESSEIGDVQTENALLRRKVEELKVLALRNGLTDQDLENMAEEYKNSQNHKEVIDE